MSILPDKKPGRGLDWFQGVLDSYSEGIAGRRVVLMAVKGYYRDSMGRVGVNDRRLYDDALFWIDTERGFLASYNGNVDPNGTRKGRGRGSAKGMASLKLGLWNYKPGMHNGSVPHAAYRQADQVTVIRDGIDGDYEDTGWFGINVHRGGIATTSSLGCLTIPPAQWPDFKETGDKLLKAAKQKTFPLILIEKQG